jgi:hypothetical protein
MQLCRYDYAGAFSATNPSRKAVVFNQLFGGWTEIINAKKLWVPEM